MVTRNVVLTDHHDRLLVKLVESGRYKNVSEVLRAGLRLLESNELALADLRTGILEGIEQVNRGELAEGTGEEAIQDAFDTAVENVNRRMTKIIATGC